MFFNCSHRCEIHHITPQIHWVSVYVLGVWRATNHCVSDFSPKDQFLPPWEGYIAFTENAWDRKRIYIYICVCVCIYIYTHTHTYIYTYLYEESAAWKHLTYGIGSFISYYLCICISSRTHFEITWSGMTSGGWMLRVEVGRFEVSCFVSELDCHGRRQWHPTPVLSPGKSHGRRSLVGCSPWGR